MNRTDLATARDLFGITFGIGTRNIPPRKGLPRKQLEVGNIINIIQPSDENCGRKFKEFIRHQRIDLVYEEACRNLTIRVVYSDVKVESEVVKETLRFPHAIQVTPAEDDRPQRVRKVKPVPCDTTFIYNDKFFCVTQSDGRRVFAVCEDDGEQLCLSNNELWKLILDNL